MTAAQGRPSPGSGPLGDRGPRGLTSRARGSRSAQGRTGPGTFGRRGRPLFRNGCGRARGGSPASRGGRPGRCGGPSGRGGGRRLWPPRGSRGRSDGRARRGERTARRGRRREARGRGSARQSPRGARATATGAFPAPSPDRAADAAGTLRSYAWPQPGTRFARALRFRAENRKRAYRLTSARASAPAPACAGRPPVPTKVLVSASRRRRGRRPRSPVRPLPRWNRPARRRPTPSR